MCNLASYKAKMKELRKNSGISIHKMAKMMRTSVSQMYHVFNGWKCSVRLIKGVAELIGIDADELIMFRYKCKINQTSQEKSELLSILERLNKINL